MVGECMLEEVQDKYSMLVYFIKLKNKLLLQTGSSFFPSSSYNTHFFVVHLSIFYFLLRIFVTPLPIVMQQLLASINATDDARVTHTQSPLWYKRCWQSRTEHRILMYSSAAVEICTRVHTRRSILKLLHRRRSKLNLTLSSQSKFTSAFCFSAIGQVRRLNVNLLLILSYLTQFFKNLKRQNYV